MKTLSVVFAVLLLSGVAAKADFKFDGDLYSLGWEAKTNHAIIKEFYARNETTNNWTTMITFQAHPTAVKVKEVSGPYFDARKSIVLVRPKLHPKRTNDFSDVVLELFVGAPGKTSHMEYTLARFIETGSGVYVVIYCYKLPMTQERNQDINADVVARHREKWIQELLEVPVEAIKQKF